MISYKHTHAHLSNHYHDVVYLRCEPLQPVRSALCECKGVRPPTPEPRISLTGHKYIDASCIVELVMCSSSDHGNRMSEIASELPHTESDASQLFYGRPRAQELLLSVPKGDEHPFPYKYDEATRRPLSLLQLHLRCSSFEQVFGSRSLQPLPPSSISGIRNPKAPNSIMGLLSG